MDKPHTVTTVLFPIFSQMPCSFHTASTENVQSQMLHGRPFSPLSIEELGYVMAAQMGTSLARLVLTAPSLSMSMAIFQTEIEVVFVHLSCS